MGSENGFLEVRRARTGGARQETVRETKRPFKY